MLYGVVNVVVIVLFVAAASIGEMGFVGLILQLGHKEDDNFVVPYHIMFTDVCCCYYFIVVFVICTLRPNNRRVCLFQEFRMGRKKSKIPNFR